MSFQSLSALLAAILTFVIGWSVILRDRRRRSYVTFTVFCFNLCFWYLASFFATTLTSDAVFWISLLLATAIPLTAERFFRSFLADDQRFPTPVSRPVWLGTVVAYVMLAIGLFYPVHKSRLFTTPLLIFIFAALYHCVFLIYAKKRSLVLGETKSHGGTAAPQAATRLTYLYIGGAASVSLAATDFLPRAFGIAFPTMGNVLTVIYMYFISQTLFHYRLLDIKELLAKMASLSVLVLVVAGIYGLLLIWVGADQLGVFFFNTIVASFVVLVLFEPLRSWIEDRVNRSLFAERYRFSRLLRDLTGEIANIIEVGPLVQRILTALGESGRVTHAALYLLDSSQTSYRLAGHVGPRPEEQFDATTRRLLIERLQEPGFLTLEALEQELATQTAQGQEDAAAATQNVIAALEDLTAAVCVPLSTDNRLLGLLTLRDDRLREAYASDELELLRAVAAHAAITLRNSQVYEQMKERDRLAALGQMAAGLAHEIRNPLGAIKGAAQLLSSEPAPVAEAAPAGAATAGFEADPESEEYLGIIVEEVNRLDRVVSQFLGYARPYRGDREPLDVNAVVAKTLQVLRSEAQDVTIETDLGRDLPDVRADPNQLHQVFLNLGLNGIQAMNGEGTLHVRTGLRVTPGLRPPGRVEIAFQDDGRGMSHEERRDIFIPFFTTKEGGTGLGLPICQRIIENHEGRIDVRSTSGEGSTFTVVLPLAA